MSYGKGDLTPDGFGGSSEHSSYHNDVPQNDFPRLTRVVSSNIQKISQNSNDVSRLVDQLGSATDSSDLRDRLSQRIHYTNQLAKDTTRFLQNIKQLPPAYQASEQRHRRTQVERLTGDFSDVLNRFQTVQREAAAKEKETLARLRASSTSQDPSGDGALVDINGGYSFQNSRMQTQEQAQISQAEMEEIEERQAAIQQLEADIVDVNMIFKDLGTMVHEQGDLIDSIEANVETAAGNVESGNQQLAKARTSASSLRKKKIICAILGIVLLAVLIIIIYYSIKGSS